MRSQFCLAIFVLFSTGCSPLSVRDDEIDWRFPVLSKHGCPDLSGRYFNSGIRRQEMMQCPKSWSCNQVEGLFSLMIRKLEKLPEYRFKDINPLQKASTEKFSPVYVTTVSYTPSEIALRLQDPHGIEYASLSAPLHHERIGCHNGALIVRTVSNSIGTEGGSGSVQYSETEIQKSPDGSLVFTEWQAWHYRSKLTGKAYGEPRDVAQRSWRFEPAK